MLTQPASMLSATPSSRYWMLLLFVLLAYNSFDISTTTILCEAGAIPNYSSGSDHSNMNVDATERYTRDWRLITRAEWGARQPTDKSNFTGPAPYVILHHSYQPGVCHTQDACKAAMRSMQNFHMDGHGWPDIGYSFAVGGDGNVYEARGYDVVGAHAPNYNSRSIGLLLIGNFMEQAPPAPMMQVAQDFIAYSVEQGYLHEDYILHGHRQVRSTECPGNVLYAEIQKWPHWQPVE